jgi:hypothetical protein
MLNDHYLAVSELISSDPWTEMRLQGTMNFSGCKHVEKESLERLIQTFSHGLRTWIENNLNAEAQGNVL